MPGMALLIIDTPDDFFRQHAHPAGQRPRLVAAINWRPGVGGKAGLE